jgi:tellurite resistance protein TerC
MADFMTLLSQDVLSEPLWGWLMFLALIAILLIIDLGLFNRNNHEIGIKESLKLSAFFIGLGLLFSVWVGYHRGPEMAFTYLTGFLVEKSLSLDNIFVIALIFGYFKIPRMYQHRVLFWGIIGAIFFRGVMIGAGTSILREFHWILYIFGAFLIYTGVKMIREADSEPPDISKNPVLKFMKKYFRVTDDLHGERFTVGLPVDGVGKKLLHLTPLAVVLVMIEIADVVFAIDSIPAIFAITTDAYIVFTSNIFAILGLRALFFALSAMLHYFEYLKYALSLVLVFIGSKILLAESGIIKFPSWVSLIITLSILTGGVVYSVYRTRKEQHAA